MRLKIVTVGNATDLIGKVISEAPTHDFGGKTNASLHTQRGSVLLRS